MTTAANGNGNPNNGPNSKSYFCPACGCSDIEASTLAGGQSKCNVCGWTGAVEELAVLHFTHDMGTPDQVFRLFFMDIRKLFTQQMAIEVGKLLIKWGFVDAPDQRNVAQVNQRIARYMGAIAMASAKAVSDTRAAIEREGHKHEHS